MRTPTQFELDRFLAHAYDPTKAHQYYEKHKKLKGRPPKKGDVPSAPVSRSRKPPSRKPKSESPKAVRSQQRIQLSSAIVKLEGQLKQLEALIKKRETEKNPKFPKLEAKKERKAKSKSLKHRLPLMHKKSPEKETEKKPSLEELQSLATRVKGQLAVAKQKLAAL